MGDHAEGSAPHVTTTRELRQWVRESHATHVRMDYPPGPATTIGTLLRKIPADAGIAIFGYRIHVRSGLGQLLFVAEPRLEWRHTITLRDGRQYEDAAMIEVDWENA